MNEEAYFKAWKAAVKKQKSAVNPSELAMLGGKLCLNANPAFIFIAGYQAAIRATFADVDSLKWLAFAASEDRGDGERKPGVTIKNHCLYGVKTWIAASKFVQQLVLKIGKGPSAKYVKVDLPITEVSIFHKPTPTFLPELSQGEAEFNGASFSELQDLSRVPMFADCEPYYIYLALLSALSNYQTSTDTSGATRQFTEKAGQLLKEHRGAMKQLAKLDQAVQHLLSSPAFEASGLLSHWGSDARLFSMYSKGIQARYGETGA